jgi:hypothetical protein
MRAEREWENPGSSGIQLWTVPVVLLALMMLAGGVRSVLAPGDGADALRPGGAPGLVSSHRYDGDGFDGNGFDGIGNGDVSGGARTGQRAAAGEQPVGRLGD